nr:reverse transcriptase domain-containing protein [Tanacetum cinerariifolium]
MSTRSSLNDLFLLSSNLESIIRNRRRNLGLILQNSALDLRTMEELLQAPIDGVGDAIVVPLILANQFELKIGLLNLVTAISFHSFANDDPYSNIRRITKITQTIKLNQVPHAVIKLILFLFSLEGAARTWLEKEPPNSITTWLNQSDQDSLNSTASGNLLTQNSQEALSIIENKSKVQTSRNKPQVSSASEAVATACYTQNRSIIHTHHHQTPYELVHNKKHDLIFFRVFGALYYPTNNNEDLRKLQPTADIGIFVGYAPSRKGYRIYNKRT